MYKDYCKSLHVDEADNDNELDSTEDSKCTEEELAKKSLLHISQEHTGLTKTESAGPPSSQQLDKKLVNNEKSRIQSLQSLVHDSIQTHSYSQSLTIHEARTQESADDISQNFAKTRSLMDLLTSKPSDTSIADVKVT